jgi:hypothetical protein
MRQVEPHPTVRSIAGGVAEYDGLMSRWIWLVLAAIALLALTAIFVLSWVLFGRDTAEATATVAAVPIAVAVVIVPPVWARSRRQKADSSVAPTLIVSATSKEGPFITLHYDAHRDDGRTIVEPRDPYLDLVRQGGELVPQEFWYSPWEGRFTWPELDVKIVNNTSNSLFFHEAVFDVTSSRLDTRPIPLFTGVAYGMYLPLENVGWGPMIDCVVRFTLAPEDEAPAVTPEFEWHVGDLDAAPIDLSLEGFFAKSGVDLGLLERLRLEGMSGEWYYLSSDSGLGEQVRADEAESFWTDTGRRIAASEYDSLRRRALGAFADGLAVLRGSLAYTQLEFDGTQTRRSNPFRSYVSFDGPLAGAPMPPSWTYNVRLRPDGRSYEVGVQISQVIKAGEADRFVLTVAADRSSLHDFGLKLVYNDGATIISEPIRLELFVSRLDARLIATQEIDERKDEAASGVD